MRPGGRPAFVLVVEPAARKDVRKKYKRYQRENPQVARLFQEAIDRARQTILDAPLRWAKCDSDIRRYLLQRFPVTLYYRVTGATVRVLRVLDQRRHPDTWRAPS